eukprot:scaffold6272_cov86-Cylindrotheca_fusiformis.AAC.2
MRPTDKSLEEEKNESSPARFVAEAAKTGEEEVQEELSLEKKQEGLPKEIKRKEYKWERDLLDDLEEFGLDDYKHIILDNNGPRCLGRDAGQGAPRVGRLVPAGVHPMGSREWAWAARSQG